MFMTRFLSVGRLSVLAGLLAAYATCGAALAQQSLQAPKPATPAKPAATKPAATKPAAAKPAPAKPVAAKPAAAKPAAGKPAAAGAAVAAAGAAAAQAAQLDMQGSWGAYASQQGKARVCYALAQPSDRLPKNLNRDPAYLFVSIRPAEKVRGEVSVVLGFSAKDGAPAQAVVDGKAFDLVTKDGKAWVRDPAQEGQVVAAFQAGTDLQIKTSSARGNALTDVYSLAGFTRIWERAQKECP